ncbi:hypothetical protein [Pyrococcus kukulkanii]|uniref:Uncharacterized protein n=1 Tax=Pyrococcus kukulkanii TaxID=1609559 RepID=A0ABV4T8R2_9EURY
MYEVDEGSVRGVWLKLEGQIYLYLKKRSLGYAEPILTFLGLKPPKVEGSIRV